MWRFRRTDSGASAPGIHKAHIQTIAPPVCRVRISAASAWASILGTLRSMPAACRSWGAGALEQFLRGAIDLFFVTVLHAKQPMFSEQRNVLSSTFMTSQFPFFNIEKWTEKTVWRRSFAPVFIVFQVVDNQRFPIFPIFHLPYIVNYEIANWLKSLTPSIFITAPQKREQYIKMIRASWVFFLKKWHVHARIGHLHCRIIRTGIVALHRLLVLLRIPAAHLQNSFAAKKIQSGFRLCLGCSGIIPDGFNQQSFAHWQFQCTS